MDLWISSCYSLFATAFIVVTFTCNALCCYFSLFSSLFSLHLTFLLRDGMHGGRRVLMIGRMKGLNNVTTYLHIQLYLYVRTWIIFLLIVDY